MATKPHETAGGGTASDDAIKHGGSSAFRRSSHAEDNQSVPASQGPRDDHSATEQIGVEHSAGAADEDTITRGDVVPDSEPKTRDQDETILVDADDAQDPVVEMDHTRRVPDEYVPPSPSRDSSTRPLYRDEAETSATQVLGQSESQVSDVEHTRVMAGEDEPAPDWDERRRARDEALGVRERPPAYEEQRPVEQTKRKRSKSPRSTDKFVPSFGLFVLRLVVAGIMGLSGVGKLLDLPSVETMLAATIIPYPEIMAPVLGIVEVLIALSLIFGVLVRLSGLGVSLIGIAALVFVLWVEWPFQNGYELTGRLELLLGAVGIMLLCVGGGRWGVDGGLRARRRRAKDEAAFEEQGI